MERNAKIPVDFKGSRIKISVPKRHDFYVIFIRRIRWEGLFDRQESEPAGGEWFLSVPITGSTWNLGWAYFEPGFKDVFSLDVLNSQDVTACTEQENSFSDPIVQIIACFNLFWSDSPVGDVGQRMS